MRTGRIEKRDRRRRLRFADVEEFDARGLGAGLGHLIGDGENIARCLQRIRAHIVVRERGLADDARRARIADIDAGEILWRPFMRDPEDPASILRDLQAHALPDATEAAHGVVRQELHILRDGALHAAAPGLRSFDA